MSIRNCEAVLKFADGRLFRTVKTIECLAEHSLSSILALSDYLSRTYPSLIPPTSFPVDKQLLDRSNSPKYISTFQLWNYFIGDCFLSGLAHRRQHILYIVLPFVAQTPEFFDIESNQCLQITGSIPTQISNTDILKAAFNIVDLKTSNKKMGICMVNPNNKLIYNIPKCLVDLLILGIFFNNQQWHIIDVANGQVPQVAELKEYNSIIITGSGESVLNQSNIYKESIINIATAVKESNFLKVVGICYGHQWIAQHFGAQVAKKEKKGGIEDIVIHSEIVEKYDFLKRLQGVPQILISQHHEDYVQTVPEGFQLLAHSASSKVESLISNDGKILTTQFHSQIPFQYMKRLVDEINSFNLYCRWRYSFADCTERVIKHRQDSITFIEVISQFMAKQAL